MWQKSMSPQHRLLNGSKLAACRSEKMHAPSARCWNISSGLIFGRCLKKGTAQLGTNSLSCPSGILPAGKFCAQQHKKLLAARQTPARQCYKDDSQLCPFIAGPSCNTLSLCYLKHAQNTTNTELFEILMK